jgi:serine/threonine protein kinase
MNKIFDELSTVDYLDQYFIHHTPVQGLVMSETTLYDSDVFINWKERAKYLLRKLNPSKEIDEILELLDGFNGWSDKSKLKKLQAKIHVILDNPKDFLPEEDYEEVMESERLKKGTILHTAFDDYEIIEQVGQGGNGKVFSAKDSDGNNVAVKFIDRNESDKKYKRFKNEIHFCENSNHKNIVKIFDRGYAFLDNKDYVFYVMPLYSETLRDKIKRGINADESVSVFIGILNGLKYAHENGTIHRDIKPENILFAENSIEPVICDFGIAHFSENELITAVETKAADRLANFQYAAPEQRVKGGANNVKGQADVYAAGLILNEMFTGEIPQSSGYKKIEDINPEYAYLDKLFEKVFQQDPNNRLFPTEKILAELKALVDIAKNNKAIKELSKNENKETESISFEIKIVDKIVKDRELIFTLDKKYPREWMSLLQTGYHSGSYYVGYGPQNIQGTNNNLLVMNIDGVNNDKTFKDIVKEVYQWVSEANNAYTHKLKNDAKREKEEQERKRTAEIERLEKENRLNSLLNEI